MQHTETIKVSPDEKRVLNAITETRMTEATIIKIGHLEDVDPSYMANQLTYHLCELAFIKEQAEENQYFDTRFVRGMLKLQEVLYSWSDDIWHFEEHQRQESAETGLAEDS